MRRMVSYKIYFENNHAIITQSTGVSLYLYSLKIKLSVSYCCALCKMHNYTFPFDMRDLVVEKSIVFGIISQAHQQILRH